MGIERDLETLCARGLELGAYRVAAMSARDVVIDSRVRMKCSVPLCEHYGHNLMCPPNVISPEDFAYALQAYQHALVVQYDFELDQGLIASKFGGKALRDLAQDGEYLRLMRGGQRRMSLALGELEKEALYMGYRFAAALAGGCCCLCDECVGQRSGLRCRHPFQARPSIESVGVDVVATAERAGLRVEFPAQERAVWTGLLLVD